MNGEKLREMFVGKAVSSRNHSALCGVTLVACYLALIPDCDLFTECRLFADNVVLAVIALVVGVACIMEAIDQHKIVRAMKHGKIGHIEVDRKDKDDDA